MNTATQLVVLCLAVTQFAAQAAPEPLPSVHFQRLSESELQLSWPAAAKEFVLEETDDLSAPSLWHVSPRTPTLTGDWLSVRGQATERTRFFRLRYQPRVLRSTNAAIVFALVLPGGSNVVAGQSFALEVRASLNAVLTGTAFRVAASGAAGATLAGRSANTAQKNGLVFLSATSQQPFESGIPTSLAGEGSVEVLLGTGTWPFDGVPPGEDVLFERLEVTAPTGGELTISLAAAEAVTSRWARDGLRFETVSLNPWGSAVTVQVQPAAKPASLGITADVPPAAEGAGVRPLKVVASSRQQAQAAATITPNADGQGDVDLADLVYVRARLGLDSALPENASADVNQDKQIDLLDLVAVRNRLPPPPSDPSQALKINEVAPDPGPGQAPWVELKYSASAQTDLSEQLELRNSAQETLLSTEGQVVLRPGWFLLAVFDGDQPMEILGPPAAPTGLKIHVPNPGLVFNPTNDQCLLYLEGKLVDAVAWGKLPERHAALNTELHPIPQGGSLGLDGYEPGRWARFTTPTPGADNGLRDCSIGIDIVSGRVKVGPCNVPTVLRKNW